MKTSRTIILLIILTLILASVDLNAQRFKGAVMGGFNISQVDGDEVYGYHRFGGNIGAAAIMPFNNWDITLEAVFNQKGAYQKRRYSGDSLTGEYNLRLNYVEVPLLVHYTDKKFISAGLGFSYGRLVKAYEEEHSGSQPPYMDSVAFRKDDWNFLADFQIRIWKRLWFNVRFAYSMAPIRERTYNPPGFPEPWTRKQYNHLWTFRLVYVFNEDLSDRVRKDQ